MKRLKWSTVKLLYLLMLLHTSNAFNIIAMNKQMLYEYVGTVAVGAKAPQDDEHPAPPTSGWIVRGKLTLQRQTEAVLAAALVIDDVTLNNSGDKFLQNKEMYPPYKPFRIYITPEGTISHLMFKEGDPIWSTNFKRAIASTLQFQMKSAGAFVADEIGIHGKCKTEYFISNKTNYISIRKNPELKTCEPFKEAIHITRSNVPNNDCEFDFQKSVIIGNEAIYGMLPHAETGYFLSMAHVKGTTLIHTFESTGEAQYINSELLLNFLNETSIDNPIDIETAMSAEMSGLELLALEMSDPTGGRSSQPPETLMASASVLLDTLAEGLENHNFKYSEPYDATVSDVIKILSEMDYESLKKLYKDVDIGTSYRQETIRNIFHEIVPRIGTKASVLLTRDLVMDKNMKTTISVQLLLSMPFHIFELSHELVKACEVFLTLGPDHPDVRQAGILTFATLVYNAFVAKRINKDTFEEYVQKYFNLYLSAGRDYEQKMMYLQALNNLQLGNVANYLEPIIKDPHEDDDTKFQAACAMLSLAHTRSEKVYETFWPIFESKSASLELRVISLTLLLISNPTPARLISIHRIIQSETDPHMINYYRTTITSISETTYPCYQQLRRLLSYMHRHLPQKPESRYWVTGNYIFDYRDSRFGIGAMLQAFMVGDPKSDLPVIAYLKFDTEALGKFTGQMALYIKARGLPDAIFEKFLKNMTKPFNFENLKTILSQMDAPIIKAEPLHLEIILQMEGKTVLVYYLNHQTFHKLTYSDLIQRVSFLISADSHINMQTVRWPFMTKYAVPTVLGTASDVLLQTTVLTSLRGNITQHRNPEAMKSTLEIDARYSSYASCRSRSYNPFLNLDHEITREQGFLVYAPFNIDFNINILTKCLKYAFKRPENLTSGLSFKSRSVTSTRGWITKSSTEPFENVMLPENNHEVFTLMKYDMEDLGISFSVNTNVNELNKYRGMLFKSGFIENGFSRNMIINFLMYVFGVAQLSSIHLGNDRNFTMLVYNENFTKIEGTLCETDVLETVDKIGQRFNLTLMHANNLQTNEVQHSWNVTIDLLSSTKSSWFEVHGKCERFSKIDNRDWKACIDVVYEPLVFAKRPHSVTGNLTFGRPNPHTDCPLNASRIQFSGRAGPADSAREFLLSAEQMLTDTDFCPKEVLKFNPIPTSKYCKRNSYENFTEMTKFETELKFSDMPEWFELWPARLEHFVSAFSFERMNRLNLNEQINVAFHNPDEDSWLTIEVNGVKWRVPHIPFLRKLDSKYDVSHEISYDSGLKRSCSLINGMVNTFDDYLINLPEFNKETSAENCSVLLVADCSPTPEMAIFLLNDSSELFNGIRVYIGDNYFDVQITNTTATDEPIYLLLNEAKTPINIRQRPYQFPANTTNYHFRVELNEQNILIVENVKMHATVQYDLQNIINFEIYNVYKKQMCGLCSKPYNRMKNYTLCA